MTLRKLLLIITLLLTTTINSLAEYERVPATIKKKENTPENSKWERLPMGMPVEIYYDSDNKIIKVESTEYVEAEIFLYNQFEELVNYSATSNAEFQLIMPGKYIVLIQGDYWSVEANISAY